MWVALSGLSLLSENGCEILSIVCPCVPVCPVCAPALPGVFESTQTHIHIHIHTYTHTRLPAPGVFEPVVLIQDIWAIARMSQIPQSPMESVAKSAESETGLPQESASARPFVEKCRSHSRSRCARACCKSRGAVSPSSARGSGFTYKVIQRWRRAQAAPAAQVCSVRSFGLG